MPERARQREGRADLYPPDSDGPSPALVFVQGGPVAARAWPTPRDWTTFAAYGRYVASLRAVGVTLDHRLNDVTDSRFRLAAAVAGAGQLPVVITRVELERPEFDVMMEEFMAAATDCKAYVEPSGCRGVQHAFEILDHTAPARQAVVHAMRSVLKHLLRSTGA